MMTNFSSKNLSQFAESITSQFGEDGILAHALDVIGESCNQWCVEFGAWDGRHLSNTFQLIEDRGYAAVLIEGDGRKFEDLRRNFADRHRVHPIHRWVDFQGKNTLDQILRETPIPRNFDVLSIDVDGNDYHIWESLVDYRPKVVVIEFNPSIPINVEFVQPRDFSVAQGSSLLSLDKLARRKGYELIATTPVNGIFVDAQYFPLFDIADNSLNVLHNDDSHVTYVFQGYDGTIFLRGCNKLMWHGIELDESRFQQLPKCLRKHPAQLGRWARKAMKWYRWRSRKSA